MLLGHYAPALFIKARYSEVSLGLLFLCVQLADIAFFSFVLGGVEKMELVDKPGPLGMDLQHLPYTHSLISTVSLFVAFVVVGRLWANLELGILLGVAAASHWVVDLIVHLEDLPVCWTGGKKVGFGLWESQVPALLLEGALLVLAYCYWRPQLKRSLSTHGRLAADGIVVSAVLLQAIYALHIHLSSVWLLAVSAIATYLLVGALGFAADRSIKTPPI